MSKKISIKNQELKEFIKESEKVLILWWKPWADDLNYFIELLINLVIFIIIIIEEILVVDIIVILHCCNGGWYSAMYLHLPHSNLFITLNFGYHSLIHHHHHLLPRLPIHPPPPQSPLHICPKSSPTYPSNTYSSNN